MRALAVRFAKWCLVIVVLASSPFAEGADRRETKAIRAALGCLLTADWARQDLGEIGWKPGAAVIIRYTRATIPGTSPDSNGILKVFVYDRREEDAWLMFADDQEGELVAVRNAYRLTLANGAWSAGEGNGGVATYEAIGKFASHVYNTRLRIRVIPRTDEHACPVRD